MKTEYIHYSRIVIEDSVHKHNDKFDVISAEDGIEKKSGKDYNTQYHIDGIEMVKKLIVAGKNVLPIAVYFNGEKYIRLDGFKRAIAFLQLGYLHIPCHVYPDKSYKSCQENMPWVVEDKKC